MSDDAAIRRANLRLISTSPGYLQEKAGKSYAYWRDLLNDPRKSFGEKAARHLEEALDLPRGWLDTPQDAPSVPPVATAPRPLTLADAVPVLLGRMACLSEYRASQVLQALHAATRPQAPLEQIERDLVQWLSEPAAALPASSKRHGTGK